MKIINHIVATATDNIADFNRPLRSMDVYLQAGAALTDIKIGRYQNNTGDSISSKNRQYCELNALYWIWSVKHAQVKIHRRSISSLTPSSF